MDFTDDDTSTAPTVEETFPSPAEATEADVARFTEQWMLQNPRAAAKRYDGADSDPTVQMPYSKSVDDDGTRFKSEFPWLYDPAKGVRWDFDPIELRVLAQENAWVGMLVQSITKEISETSWTITEADDPTETQKRLSTHPDEREPIQKELPDEQAEDIYNLLMDPSPDYDWYDAVEMWMADLLEIGSMTAVKAFPTSAYDEDDNLAVDAAALTPRAIMPSAPEVWTKDYSDKSGVLDGYWQFDNHSSPGAAAARTRGVGQPIPFDRQEVIWSDMAPRTNRRYGMPPTLLVRDFLQSLDLAVTQEQQYLSRGSIPSGAWVFEAMDMEQMRDIRSEFRENVKGKPHKSLFLGGEGGDVKFEPMSMNFKELEFTERMRWYARVVASAFQVPTAVVGIEPEKVNYATFQGERENFESNTLGPYLQQLERIINSQIIQPHWGSDYRFEFVPGMSETTRKMISDRVGQEFDKNLTTRNEARRELGREPVDESEDGFKDDVVDDASENPFGDVTMSVSKGDPTRDGHDVDPGEGVGYCENSGKEFECETMGDLAGDCPHCGDPISYIDEDDLDKTLSKDFEAELYAITPPAEDADKFDGDVLGLAVNFPNDAVYIDWHNDVFPDALEHSHVSIYGSTDDLTQATGNELQSLGTVDAESGELAQAAKSIRKSATEDSADFRKGADDEPLRNTDQWAMFDVQPHEIEALHDEIADDVAELYDQILSDDEVERLIEQFAETDGSDTTEKSLTGLSRRIQELLSGSDVADRIREAVEDARTSQIREAIEHAAEQEDDDIDTDPIMDAVVDRELPFADRMVDRVSEQVREKVADGWQDGKNSLEIRDDIADAAGAAEDWGTERIARQELQVAAGEARNAYAAETNRVEVWRTSGDGRVREPHAEMDGKWKRPSEEFRVDYSSVDRGIQTEKVPGSSEPGIGCRCFTELVDISEVDDADHAGV